MIDAGEDADVVEDDDLGEIAPQTTKGAHLNSELDSDLNKSFKTQKVPANDEDQQLLQQEANDHPYVKQHTEYKDVPGAENKEKQSVLDDLADLGIFSDHDIEPKKEEGGVPEIHITNVQNSWA